MDGIIKAIPLSVKELVAGGVAGRFKDTLSTTWASQNSVSGAITSSFLLYTLTVILNLWSWYCCFFAHKLPNYYEVQYVIVYNLYAFMMPDFYEFFLELYMFTKSWIVDGITFDKFTVALDFWSLIVHQCGYHLHYDGMKKMVTWKSLLVKNGITDRKVV